MAPTKKSGSEDTTPMMFKTPSQGKRRRLRSNLSQRTPSNASSNGSEESNAETPGAKERAMMAIPASPCLRKLGYGTGVKVFLYERSPRSGGAARSPWAIKKFSKKTGGQNIIAERLDEEASILKSLNHPHIIGFRGYKRHPDGSRVLAVENGERALFDIIEDMEDGEIFPAAAIEKTVAAVAAALHYLHTEKRLLHGDLKSGNVLVRGDFEAVKLCDFGVTLPLGADLRVVESRRMDYVGTGPWCAREAMDASKGDVSDKTDVFALGCVIFEMLALRSPHVDLLPGMDDDEAESDGSFDEDEYDDSEYQEALGTRPALPEGLLGGNADKEYLKVLSLFYACTEEDPGKRPSAEKVLEALKVGKGKEEKENAK